MNFKIVQLSDVCDLQNGYAFKSIDYVENSNTCNIRMSNIRPGGNFNEFHNQRYLPDSFANQYKEYLLNDGDLIIAMTDMATETKILGLPTLVNNTTGRNFLLNQRVGKLCKFSNEIYVPYLRHVLTAPEVIDYYKSKGAGGLQINISKKDILSVKFPLPSLAAQHKIVAKLDAIFSEIEKAKIAIEANINNVELIYRSYLAKIFNGSNWESKKLSELIELITKGTTPTSIGHNFTDSGINFIKIESITNRGDFIQSKFAHISDKCNDDLNRSQLKEGDILFSIAGALGRTAIVTKDVLPANTNQALSIIRLREDAEIHKKYLMKVLNSEGVVNQIQKFKGGVAQQNLSLAQVKNFKIPIPSLELQVDIVKKIELLEESVQLLNNKYSNKVNELVLLKQSVLSNVFLMNWSRVYRERD